MRPRLGLQQGCRIPGFLHGELGLRRVGAARHVAMDEADGALEMIHTGTVVEAVRPPERREPIAAGVERGAPALAEPVGLMASRAHAAEDFGSTLRISG